jgi:hypothetical protein
MITYSAFFPFLPFAILAISIHIGFKSVITSVISFHYQKKVICSTTHHSSNEQTHSAGDGHVNMPLILLDTVYHFSDPIVRNSSYNAVISTGPTVWGLENVADIKKDEIQNSVIVHMKNKAARYILIQQIKQLHDSMFLFNVCEVKVYATEGILLLLLLNIGYQERTLIRLSILIFFKLVYNLCRSKKKIFKSFWYIKCMCYDD